MLYFYVLEGPFFHGVMAPALSHAHRQRSFAPCHDLCRQLLAENAEVPPDSIVRAVLTGLPFERSFWQGLVGECLVHGARDIPRLATAPASLCCLLAPTHHEKPDAPRDHYAPIQQVHFGSRDLRFGGGFYRPDHVGLNDHDDVTRLAAYLEAIDCAAWSPGQLKGLPDLLDDTERAEELAYVRDWWPSLVELYQNARGRQLVVVCEEV
jgi:hypothetical protein